MVVQGMTNKQYFVFLYYFYSVTVENNCLYKTSALIHLSQDEQQFKNLKDVLQNSYKKNYSYRAVQYKTVIKVV